MKSLDHPATGGKAIARIVKIKIAGDTVRVEDWLGRDLAKALGSEVPVLWLTPTDSKDRSKLATLHMMTPRVVAWFD